MESNRDLYYLKRALRLANTAKGKTFPNPAVGAVIVNNDNVVGSGATQKCGGHHAEKVALIKAGDKAKGATLYVTLEPCCHFGRTPPCTDAVIAAGIRRVVVTQLDPNPLVAGKGLDALRDAGIEVSSGLLERESSRLNEDFFWSITKKRAWVTLKLAMTLDGRIADDCNVSKWITGEKSRNFVHELRRIHAAVAVGRSTLEIDDPQLTVRHKKGYFPARIIFSPDEFIAPDSFFYQHGHDSRSIVVVRGGAKHILKDTSTGLEFWYTGHNSRGDSMISFLETAYEQGITSVFLEGGQRLASQLLETGLVNRIYFFYGNRLLGKGKEGILFSEGLPMNKCISLEKMEFKSFGEDLMVTGIPLYSSEL
jgi:diaminohydroxyphosphoribosylaminopyrimidine deaminase / 5-amino-6-(5-phosphoribosylamino)uracil reductase